MIEKLKLSVRMSRQRLEQRFAILLSAITKKEYKKDKNYHEYKYVDLYKPAEEDTILIAVRYFPYESVLEVKIVCTFVSMGDIANHGVEILGDTPRRQKFSILEDLQSVYIQEGETILFASFSNIHIDNMWDIQLAYAPYPTMSK